MKNTAEAILPTSQRDRRTELARDRRFRCAGGRPTHRGSYPGGEGCCLPAGPERGHGISDDYDFFSATEYLSHDPEHPTIFQNQVTNVVPAAESFAFPACHRSPCRSKCRPPPTPRRSVSFKTIRSSHYAAYLRLWLFQHLSTGSHAARPAVRPYSSRRSHDRIGRFAISIQADI